MTTFRKPIAGEPANLILGESFQSALVDVVNAFNRGELTINPTEIKKDHVIMVKNVSGQDVKTGELLAISEDVQAPTYAGTIQSYLQNPLTLGNAVSWHGNIGYVAVASQPILDGMLGPCAFRPWGQAQADIGGAGDWLMVNPENPKQFKYATGGIARVINIDYTTGKCVADFRQQQLLWRYELLTDVVNLSASANLLDLAGVFYGTITLRFLRNDEKAGDVGQCLHTGNYFDAIEDEQPTPRFRFRLKTSFDDTGQATAKVLDTFGTVRNPDGSIVALGDILTVNDPRKLFAHAIGFDDLTAVHAGASAFFPAGGSVGYAVETEQLKADPADPDDPQYPRWEVEQCTQIIDKMIVQIQAGEPSTPGVTGKPTGILGEGDIELKFVPDTAILSRWPDVDYCAEWLPPVEPGDPWTIQTKNPNRFSAGTGWAIIERRENKSRAEDAENVDTPYAANVAGIPEWHITEVENPISRWLCATFNGGDDAWVFSGVVFEGENPVTVNYFADNAEVGNAIQTASCLAIDCLKPGQEGVAFWNPNDQKYNVVSTNSALYGTAVDIEAIAQKTATAVYPLLDFVGCDLNYIKSTPIKVFGMNEECEETKTTETASPDLVTVDVITGSYRSGDDLCFTKTQVYVCSSVPIEDPDCVYICCEDEYGCCEYPPGTFTPNVSQTSCTTSGGTWTPGPCPVPCMVECSHCSSGGAKFTFAGISWDAASSTSGLPGNAVVSTAVWTAGSGNCCMTLTVDFTNGGTTTTHSAEVCIQSAAGCPMASLELNLVWTAPTFDGVTLPTTLGGGMIMDCTGSYGKTSGCVVPVNPGALGAGNWDEADIEVADCSIT